MARAGHCLRPGACVLPPADWPITFRPGPGVAGAGGWELAPSCSTVCMGPCAPATWAKSPGRARAAGRRLATGRSPPAARGLQARAKRKVPIDSRPGATGRRAPSHRGRQRPFFMARLGGPGMPCTWGVKGVKRGACGIRAPAAPPRARMMRRLPAAGRPVARSGVSWAPNGAGCRFGALIGINPTWSKGIALGNRGHAEDGVPGDLDRKALSGGEAGRSPGSASEIEPFEAEAESLEAENAL